MEELKKAIIDNLYKSNFYEALINIQKLETSFPDAQETLFLYYYLYDLMSWVSHHKKHNSKSTIQNNKDKYFNQILQINQNNRSITYFQLYLFLEENFRTFEHFSWFSRYGKSKYLLDQALKENQDNLETQFYSLFCEEKTKECFEFLSKNILDTQIVQKFLNNLWFKDEFLDDSQQLKQLYGLGSEHTDLFYYTQKKDYNWLYDYFNEDEERKYKTNSISYGEVCFETKKYDEAIKYYENKDDKSNNDYFILGECYEQQDEKEKAINCYKNYYTNFSSGNWQVGIKKLFKLQAYDEIKYVLKTEKSNLHKEYKIFYEAKLLSIEKKYIDSINTLNGIFDKLHNHHEELKKDIYFLYISNYYKETMKAIEQSYHEIIESNDFELSGPRFLFGFDYHHLSLYRDFEKYIKKLNIEFDNKYYKLTEQCRKRINNRFIEVHKKLYSEIQIRKINITEDRELYYLSAFEDLDSINKRISIFKNRIKNEAENPRYYLELGKLHYKKVNLTKYNFKKAIKYLEKSIELAEKYFVNLYGEAELLLVKIKESKEDKKALFDKSIKDFIFYNSYQKDSRTMFFAQTLYKYQSFSINGLSGLSENYLYFANPDQLNDPFDVASESLEKQFKNLKLNKNDFKLCSLSQINDNKLMWSHYTQEHTGICVGYKFLYLPYYVGKDEVKYKNTNLDEKEIFDNIIEYWTVKSEDWEYEKEVRLLHYGEKQKIFYTFDINEALEKNIIALQIESITFGLKFQNKTILKPIILEIEKKQNRKINFFKAKISEQKLIIEKVEI
ncbi:DUF2971 domain-containing protein [Sulfurimonas sp.]|uniref:DUF2971 domain-containing protein n=1 Tax=Sulfurimonas sp. TaxID=2022749 RepID=UPI002634BF05|nr:DUF2971 domain-containing protein [Sulfurimonas sp.]MDD5156836.1 DUF2971 domain-containing protein [Sulfurimonas sp.]